MPCRSVSLKHKEEFFNLQRNQCLRGKKRKVKIPHHLMQNGCVLLSYLILNFDNRLPKPLLSRLMLFRASADRLFNTALPLYLSLILYSGFIIHIMKLPWQHAGLAAASGVAFPHVFSFFPSLFLSFLLSVFVGGFNFFIQKKNRFHQFYFVGNLANLLMIQEIKQYSRALLQLH